MSKTIKHIELEKNGVTEIFDLVGKSDGVMAEGTVRGVRALVPSMTVASKTWKKMPISYLDGDESMINSDGNFCAPVDGIYMFIYRPCSQGGKFGAEVNLTVAKNDNSFLPENLIATVRSGASTTSVTPTVNGVVKLKKGDWIHCQFQAATATTFLNDSQDMPCEFYLISERSDGLIAEAKYAAQNFAKDALQQVKLVDSTDTSVLSNDCVITLPEDGYYLFSSDNLNGTASTTSHAVTAYLYENNTSGRIVGYHTVNAQTLATPPINQVIAGKKGDQFLLTVRHSSYAYNFVRKPNDTNSGVKLFKMSFAGSGGGGGTSDYDDLTNKPSINGVELTGDKTSNDLDIFSKVDYTYEDDTYTLNLLANEGAGKELTSEHKTGETYNGKPVYSKEISLTFGSSDGRIADISDLNIETLIDFTGYYRYTSNQLPVQFGYNSQCYVYFSPANSPIQMNAYALNTQSKNTTGKAIIRYTKK